MQSVGVILGSAFDRPELEGRSLVPERVQTRFGEVTLWRFPCAGREAWVLFRHGVPHKLLPHQIPYRAHAAALGAKGCRALLVTSSVGVLDASLPLDSPLVLSDLMMLDNRLPDGSACTIYPEPVAGQGHLVLEEGLLSSALSRQVESIAVELGWTEVRRAVFAYVPGPRTKTAAENQLLARLGAQVNSMTVGPEVVLANELEIPTAAVVVGHKHSTAEAQELDPELVSRSLRSSREILERLAAGWLQRAEPVPFGNRIYRF
jgi:5'-methylthioadenosine phosphorylase